jgi:hypothetical protein
MGEIDENLDALENDVVGSMASDVRDKADAAGVVFIAGIIQPLRLG